MTLKTLAICIPLLPAAGAVLVGLIGLRGLRSRSHWLVIAGVGAALVAATMLFDRVRSHADDAQPTAQTITIYEWFNTGDTAGSWFDVEFLVDPLTCVMLLTVLSVSLLVVIYSVGYMRDHHGQPERGYERFFAFLGLFVFSMCTLVLAGNFLLLYLGWELVGLCSYLLIGFYYDKPAAAQAAKKAFLVNRIGDFGFGLGILLIYLRCGDLSYDHVFSAAGMQQLAGYETIVALLLFCGAVGKSAQLPLHVWLPDAMEGPTPVSALIHAATMVTAGVYMVARCSVIFAASPVAMWVVACIGAATALFAATIAVTQYDMKRILAYSTISQLGYMFLGLGVGAFDSAIFHLFTHAFFKACLFLGAGSVMHAMAGVIDIRRFGGLAKGMKVTAATFWIGGLALAGFPLLAGFWSKDEIVAAALHSQAPWLGWIALLTALMTAFYTFRMIFIAFHGPERLPNTVDRVHENGRWVTIPLIVLAVGAVGAGYLGFPPHQGGLHGFLEPVFRAAQPKLAVSASDAPHDGHLLLYVSAGISILGIWAAWYIYRRRPTVAGAAASGAASLHRMVYNKYFVDEAYDVGIVQPLRKLGRFCHGVDRFFINAILWVITAVPRAVGFGLRGMQQGSMQGYAMGMVVGVIAIVIWMLIRMAGGDAGELAAISQG
ncbi:MAG: NADH-quinone oxidoreductase subunit L [Planctomycetota bacterium]|nr:NADH-quinone oxidoreductase subunit L [Planctomycetota bacterium]